MGTNALTKWKFFVDPEDIAAGVWTVSPKGQIMSPEATVFYAVPSGLVELVVRDVV